MAELAEGAAVGTGSARRSAQVRAVRPDLQVQPLRGNVGTRVERVQAGELEAAVLALAGLERAGLDTAIAEVLEPPVFLSAPAQGALAVEVRTNRPDVERLVERIDDAASRAAVTAERAFLRALRGGCNAPVGALAVATDAELTMTAGLFGEGEEPPLTLRGRVTDADALGPVGCCKGIGGAGFPEPMRAQPGTIYLVGAGPGDPKLITVHGREVLESADVVVHDRLVSRDLLKLARTGARMEDVGKAPGRASRSQAEINNLLVQLAGNGLSVCRLKGGDPFVFGRGGEEVLAARAAGIPVVVVPGVSSALAGPAAADVPVTHRGVASSVTVVTGHDAQSATDGGVDWQRIAGTPGTIVVLMGVGNLGSIARRLVDGGRSPDEPVRVIEGATLPGQRAVSGRLSTIDAIAREVGLRAPAVIVVGPVVGVLDGLDGEGT